MSDTIVINAEFRTDVGKGASRRLRKQADKVPGILYGAEKEPVPLLMTYRDLAKAMQEEAFFSQILEISVGDQTQQAVLRDLQRNPATEKVMHVDFLRISADKPIQVSIPLHFINEDICVGVKTGGGSISHNLIEVEVSCLPALLPEFIEVDMAELDLNESIHLSALSFPEGVTSIALSLGDDHDITVVSVQAPRGGSEEEDEAQDAAIDADADADADDAEDAGDDDQ